MDSRDKLVEMVNQFHTYLAHNPEAEIEDFCRFYLLKGQKHLVDADTSAEYARERHLTADFFDTPFTIEGQLGKALGRLTKFSFMYSRKGLTSLGLNNLEDFVYLVTIFEHGTPKKSEIIHKNLSEFSSGIEVIKRLKNLDLLYEFPDEDDRRSRRVGLTPKGMEVLRACFPLMTQIAYMTFGDLMPEEKEMILHIFSKLDKKHSDMYDRTKQKTFQEILEIFQQ
ncbi:MAG: MarR family transcriptional regulator [Microscillaceae bacterium]|nr:MarR family transcriptional regulator [Microscillaceae bacterium]